MKVSTSHQTKGAVIEKEQKSSKAGLLSSIKRHMHTHSVQFSSHPALERIHSNKINNQTLQTYPDVWFFFPHIESLLWLRSRHWVQSNAFVAVSCHFSSCRFSPASQMWGGSAKERLSGKPQPITYRWKRHKSCPERKKKLFSE